MNEAEFKRKLVESVKRCGGYARRIEDQFAVGTLDCIFIPYRSLSVYFVEAKIIRSNKFEPSPRQQIEMDRIISALSVSVAVKLVGWDEKAKEIRIRDAAAPAPERHAGNGGEGIGRMEKTRQTKTIETIEKVGFWSQFDFGQALFRNSNWYKE